MKVFISQPMNGLTTLEILNQRERAIDILKAIYKDEEIEVLDTIFKLEEGTHPLVYLCKRNIVNQQFFLQTLLCH